MFLSFNFLFGQQKLFESILNNAEKNVEKNYYTDSISAIRHSGYIVNDSTKKFEKVVYLEYFPKPMWTIDGKYYNQKFGFNDSIFPVRLIGYLITAKLYKKNDEFKDYDFYLPRRFSTPFGNIDSFPGFIDIGSDVLNYSIAHFVWNNKEKRNNLQNKNNDTNLSNKINLSSFDTNDNPGKPKISMEYGNINNERTNNSNSVSINKLPEKITMTSPPIYTIIADTTIYIVDNVIYDEIDCYRLTKKHKTKSIYTESDRQRFENETLKLEYPSLSEQKKNEFRQLVDYWANGETSFSQIYIIDKKKFAVLSFLQEQLQQNYKGEWSEIEKITEKYKEGKSKKYYQTFYSKFVRNYDNFFPNLNNIVTVVIKTPLNKVFPLNQTSRLLNNNYLKYENFCEKVDSLDDNMLLDWNNYESDVMK